MNPEQPTVPPAPRTFSLRTNRARKGFTLVELLVVIGIIALLIAILLPALNKARAQGQWAACLSNMKQIGNALMAYANENKGFYPRAASGSNGPFPDDFIFWQEVPAPGRNSDDSALVPYIGTSGDKFKAIMRCPTDNYADRPVIPGREAYGAYRYSYSMNSWWVADPQTSLTGARHKIGEIRNASEKILMIEEKQPNDGRWDYSQSTQGGDDELGDRHAKMGNILYNDYHVNRLFWKDVQLHLGQTGGDPSDPFVP